MIGTEHTKVLVLGLAAVAFGLLASRQRGACIGLLLLAVMNGLPAIDTSSYVAAHFTLQDLAVCLLLAVAGVWALLDARSFPLSRTDRIIIRAATVLLLWWLWTIARTTVGDHVPMFRAMAFGRDFAYFALLLMVLPRVRLTSHDIRVLLVILAIGVCLYAIGQITTALGIGGFGSLINVRYTLQQSGLTRVYSFMTDLVIAGLAVSIAAILMARQPFVRLIALPITLLLTISIVVQLTRARWIGLIFGLLFVTVWFVIRNDADISALLRRRLTLSVSIVGIIGIALIATDPGILSGGTLAQRALSIISDLQSSSGSVGVREAASKTTTTYLGGQWPFGLGLIPPYSHYYAGLPEGSIRDSDLGVLNAVVTMGIVGAILIYVPVVFGLVCCLRRFSLRHTEFEWLRVGGAVWIVATLVSSVTLVTLYSVSGLVLTAVFLMVLIQPAVLEALAPSPAIDSQAISSPALYQPNSQLIEYA